MMNLPSNTWEAVIETRKKGAQGSFELKTFRLRAEDRETAINWFLEDVELEGLEPRAIIKMEKLS